MALDIGTLVGYLDLDKKAYERKLDDSDDDAKRSGRKSGRSFGDHFNKESNDKITSAARRIMKSFGDVLGVTAKPTAVTVATAFSAQFLASIGMALASGAAKLAHGFAAVLALLPAAALAGGLAIGTLKVALSGMGDALKAGLSGDTEAFNEALEGMPPPARAVAREIAGLKGQLDALKSSVQTSFFTPLVGQVRPLAELYLPILNTHMSDLARHFGQTGNAVSSWLQIPSVANAIDGALANANISAGDLAGAASHLPRAFLPLLTVGSTFLPGMTDGLRGLTAEFADFMQEAERTGALRDFIQGGLDAIGSLIETGEQVGRIFGNIGTVISTAFSSGGGLLAGLGLQTGGILDTFERLTEQAADFVQSARGSTVVGQIFTTIRALLNALFGTLSRVVTILARVFGPILPQIAETASAFMDLTNAVMDSLEPALMVVSDVLGSVVLPALTGLMNVMSENRVVLGALAGIVVALFTAWAISAGAAAIATIAAALPLILIGAAVGALAALVIIHFDTIKNAIMTAFNWVRDNWPLLLAILTGPIGIAVLLITTHWDTIKSGFTAVKNWIRDRIGDIVGFFTGLPGRLADAASGLWDWLTGGISAAVDWVRQRINDLISAFNALPFVDNIDRIGGATKSFGGSRGRGGRRLHTGRIGGDEMVAILQKGESVLAKNDPLNQALLAGGSGRGGLTPVVIRFERSHDKLDDAIMDMVRHRIRVDSGGDVQVALGQ